MVAGCVFRVAGCLSCGCWNRVLFVAKQCFIKQPICSTRPEPSGPWYTNSSGSRPVHGRPAARLQHSFILELRTALILHQILEVLGRQLRQIGTPYSFLLCLLGSLHARWNHREPICACALLTNKVVSKIAPRAPRAAATRARIGAACGARGQIKKNYM